MMVRDFRLMTKSDLARIHALVRPVIVRWASQWLGLEDDNAVILSARSIDDLHDPHGYGRSWLILQKNESEWIALGAVSDVDRMIVEACFGVGERNLHVEDQTLASRIVNKVTRGLCEAVLTALKVGGRLDEWRQVKAELPSYVWDVASGAGYVTIRIGEKTVDLVLSPLMVNRIVVAGSPSALDIGKCESVRQAIESESVTLEIAAGECDISLRELRTMAEGDVIKLNIQVNQPLHMFLGTKQVGQVVLGAKDGHKAVRVLRLQ